MDGLSGVRALIEKMTKDNPKKKDYFESLLVHERL